FSSCTCYQLSLHSFPTRRSSDLFSSLNELRAQLTRKINSLRNQEAGAEFAAQLTLLEQTVTNYLELSTSADKTDEYYTKIVVQLDRKSTRLNSSHVKTSYAVFCL